jgi:hypothetical protein
MKPKRGIKKICIKWVDCGISTKLNSPLFFTGGGAYEAWGFSDVWHYQKHFYFYKWCYLTIKGVRYGVGKSYR